MGIKFRRQDTQFFATPVDNLFIDEYMGRASGEFVKVYLFCLRISCYPLSEELTIEDIAKQLDMGSETVSNALSYWNRQGLVRIEKRQPLELELLSLGRMLAAGGAGSDKEIYQYSQLNNHLQKTFEGRRVISFDEFQIVYGWVEDLGLQEETVPLLVQHGIDRKGWKVSFRYLDKIALDWANKGIKTAEETEQYLRRYEEIYGGAGRIMKQWNFNRHPTEDEIVLYRKWVRNWGFDPAAIIRTCSQMTSVANPNFAYLDKMLESLHKKDLHSVNDVTEYFEKEKYVRSPLTSILHQLGYRGMITDEMKQRYATWREWGFDEETLTLVAKYLARENRTTPEDLHAVLTNWKQRNFTAYEDINSYMERMTAAGDAYQQFIVLWGEHRSATAMEKRAYLNWTKAGHSAGLIAQAAEYARGAKERVAYMNTLLENWRTQGITSPQQAISDHTTRKISAAARGEGKVSPGVHFEGEPNYSDEELDSFFVELDGD